MTKILVCFDGSKCSMDALDYAIEIAQKEHNPELIIIHVMQDLKLTSNQMYYLTFSKGKLVDEIVEKAKQESSQILEKINKKVDKYKEKFKIETKIFETGSSVVGGVIEYADKEEIDLIVIGTRGNTGFKKLLIGSTAQGVVTYAHCPVLVVK
ncbi:MAG: universal stress protein [Nitrososphaeraceae archaeon]